VIAAAAWATVTEAVPEALPPTTDAVIVAVPFATAVTTPLEFTDATLGADEDQVNVASETVELPAMAVAVSACVSPRVTRVDAVGETATEVTSAMPTPSSPQERRTRATTIDRREDPLAGADIQTLLVDSVGVRGPGIRRDRAPNRRHEPKGTVGRRLGGAQVEASACVRLFLLPGISCGGWPE